MKASADSPIPAPLRDWLDNAILSQMSDSKAGAEHALMRKTSIAHAILYPLETKTRKTKAALR